MKRLLAFLIILLPLGVSAEDAELDKLAASAGSSAQGAFEYGKALEEQGRHSDAVRSFRKALELDAKHEAAHRALGHAFIEGKWITRAERDAPRRAARVKTLTQAFGNQKFGRETKVTDCEPDSPFLLIFETPLTKDKQFTPEFARLILKELAALFRQRFGDLCDADDIISGEVLPIYVFADKAGYAKQFDETPLTEGHVDATTGTLYMYSDDNIMIGEALCGQGIGLLLSAATQRNEEDPAKRKRAGTGWFMEGASRYFRNYSYGPTGFTVGNCYEKCLRYAQDLAQYHQDLKIPDLLALSSQDMYKKEDPLALGSQSWAFWYFLETADIGKKRRTLDLYIAREFEQRGGFETAKACFGDLNALDREYREFLKDLK